jgi:hypothetical protein
LQGALALITLGIGLWWWDYTRVKTAYYQDIVEVRATSGSFRLDGEAASF